MILYSIETDLIYDTSIHKVIPNDAVKISLTEKHEHIGNITYEGKRRVKHVYPFVFEGIPLPSTEELRTTQKQLLAAKRWDICQGSVLIDGVEVQSDKDSKDEMSGYVTESVVNGLVSVNWKRGSGEFSVYTVQQFKKIYQLVAKYRNDCFGVEMAKLAEIDAAEDPATVDIETGWPNREFTTV